MFSLVNLQMAHPNLLVGTSTLDDAGVYRISETVALVQTVDYFTPVVDDAFSFGQIAAANALSDVYAMGGTPITVLNIVGYPISKLPPETLAEILRGGASKVQEAGAVIVGGHSIDDSDPKFGLSVTGVCQPDKIWTNAGAEVGDVLVLTKPLGVGVLTTAIKRGLASEDEINAVTAVMATLNKATAEVAHGFTVHACTDVTGFGLLGHALEMARGSNVQMEFYSSEIPMIEGAEALAQAGAIPGGSKRNRTYVEPFVQYDKAISETMRTLVTDSITSGGLLLAVPEAEGAALVRALHLRGVESAAVIGRVAGQAAAGKEAPWILVH